MYDCDGLLVINVDISCSITFEFVVCVLVWTVVVVHVVVVFPRLQLVDDLYLKF